MLPTDVDTSGDGARRRGDANGRSDSDASDALVASDAGCGGGWSDVHDYVRSCGGRRNFAMRRDWARLDSATVPDWTTVTDWLRPGPDCFSIGW